MLRVSQQTLGKVYSCINSHMTIFSVFIVHCRHDCMVSMNTLCMTSHSYSTGFIAVCDTQLLARWGVQRCRNVCSLEGGRGRGCMMFCLFVFWWWFVDLPNSTLFIEIYMYALQCTSILIQHSTFSYSPYVSTGD